MNNLVYLSECCNEVKLVAECPVYLRIMKAPKRDCLRLLYDSVDNHRASKGKKHVAGQLSYPVFAHFLVMDWGRVSAHTTKMGHF